jgi:hypothetical protein
MRKSFLLILLVVLVTMLGPPSLFGQTGLTGDQTQTPALVTSTGMPFTPAIEVSPSLWLKPTAADVIPFKLHSVLASSTTAPTLRPAWALFTTLSAGYTWADWIPEVSYNVILPNEMTKTATVMTTTTQ